MYHRRVDRYLEAAERTTAEVEDAMEGVLRVIADAAARRGNDDGWLAVFLEFWTHVLRHPEHRARFAEIHAQAADPFVSATERFAAERGIELPLDARQLTVALFAMGTGIGLERLTQPEVVDGDLMVRMQKVWFEALARAIEPRKET